MTKHQPTKDMASFLYHSSKQTCHVRTAGGTGRRSGYRTLQRLQKAINFSLIL
jgi:hypothetical protein